MNFTKTMQLLILPLGLTAIVIASQVATATHPTSVTITTNSISIPSGGHIGPIPIGGGGHYEGPGDTVPPCDGCPVPPGQCNMPLGYVCDGPDCLEYDWVPDALVCKYPQYGSSSVPVWTQGYMLTMGDIILEILTGGGCVDAYGNITTRITSPFPVDEVHVFESGFINGYSPAPISESVSATVCFDGNPTVVGWAFNQVSYDYDCEIATVSITFSQACMQQALLDWYTNGTNLGDYWNSWLFYVDFVSCDPCEEGGIIIEPWERGVYPGPGDIVPID